MKVRVEWWHIPAFVVGGALVCGGLAVFQAHYIPSMIQDRDYSSWKKDPPQTEEVFRVLKSRDRLNEDLARHFSKQSRQSGYLFFCLAFLLLVEIGRQVAARRRISGHT